MENFMTDDSFTRLDEGNFSDYFYQEFNYSHLVTKAGSVPEVHGLTLFHNILSPTIIIAGLIGNSLSLGVFFNQRLPAHRNYFLAALACADNCFLLSSFVTWLDKHVPLTQERVGCSVLLFLNYVSSSLSSWFTLCFTTERFIYVRFPLRAPVLCSRRRQKVLTFLLMPLAAMLYSFPLWTVDTQPSVSRTICITNFRFLQQVKAFTWMDMTLTMILPFVLMTAMNLNSFLLIQRQSRTRALQLQGGQSQQTSCPNSRENRHMITRLRMSASTAALRLRLTKVLLIVSAAFLVLNLPAHATRLHKLLGEHRDGGKHWYNSVVGQIFDTVFQLMYLASFSVNFLLYTTRNNNFKTTICALCRAIRGFFKACCTCCKRRLPRERRASIPLCLGLAVTSRKYPDMTLIRRTLVNGAGMTHSEDPEMMAESLC